MVQTPQGHLSPIDYMWPWWRPDGPREEMPDGGGITPIAFQYADGAHVKALDAAHTLWRCIPAYPVRLTRDEWAAALQCVEYHDSLVWCHPLFTLEVSQDYAANYYANVALPGRKRTWQCTARRLETISREVARYLTKHHALEILPPSFPQKASNPRDTIPPDRPAR